MISLDPYPYSGWIGPRFRVKASKEVILSAGSVNTPAILLHSGIGDRNELSKFGIQPLHQLSSVGKNASDQCWVALSWRVNSNNTFDNLIRNKTLFNEAFKLWNETHMGPLGIGESSHLAWKRIPQNSPIFKQFQDPTAGPKSPHIELLFTVYSFPVFNPGTHC